MTQSWHFVSREPVRIRRGKRQGESVQRLRRLLLGAGGDWSTATADRTHIPGRGDRQTASKQTLKGWVQDRGYGPVGRELVSVVCGLQSS